MKTIAFFNNKGGVGKTTLVYHLAWMFSENGLRTLAVDLDPQANLTSMFLNEERLEELWPDSDHNLTILGDIQPILKGLGDIPQIPHVENIPGASGLGLIPGDLGLSRFEDKLSDSWPRCQNKDEAAFRIMTAFHRIIVQAASDKYDIALVDVGPNLGSINRSALIASDQVIIPLSPDLFSLQGLKNLGPTLKEWRSIWPDLLTKAPKDLSIPKGEIKAAGYVILQHSVRDTRPVKAYLRWMDRIPQIYREYVLDDSENNINKDIYNLALLKHYKSLMPLAMEARKPMFYLQPADGAIGAHVYAVKACYDDFYKLAQKIANNAGLAMK
jgi:cellulose biosynthesis protein BcsQ